MLTREEYFPGQHSQEQIALFIRRHWVAFILWVFVDFVLYMTILGLATYFWSATLTGFLIGSKLSQVIIVLTSTSLILMVNFYFLRAWMSYYLDITIVTERRLIDIEQEGIYRRHIAEQSLARVQDVSAKQHGFFEHFFNYGTLYIETAGDQPNFELHNIPKPFMIAKTIMDLHDRMLHGDLPTESNQVGGEVEEFSEEEHQKKVVNHPLERLRTYFPEPETTIKPGIVTKRDNTEIKPNKKISNEGEIKEGESIRLI